MPLLDTIDSPEDLRRLPPDALPELAREIREALVATVTSTGGHLGPNLGVVELSIALHRVFRSPHDRVVFDTGHQAYVHKMLTGRRASMSTLRSTDGLSGYPSRAESPHDVVENSHASTALSYADGLARALQLRDDPDGPRVVAVVGDGALTGGMCWEALNSIGAAPDRPVVVVLNDNGRSYSPTVGALAVHLAELRRGAGLDAHESAARYDGPGAPAGGGDPRTTYDVGGGTGLDGDLEQGRDALVSFLRGNPAPASTGAPTADRTEASGVAAPSSATSLFAMLGLAYLGPVDGHDEAAVEAALRHARDLRRPVVVHVVTRKGAGYARAEDDELDRCHAVSRPRRTPHLVEAAPTWTDVFAAAAARLVPQRPRVVAVTAAMLHPTGLGPLARTHPERVADVGIAEQHAVTAAAGLAMGGMHPLVCIYSTFLNRAFDQVLMDVGLHRLPVTFVLDRAGVTGDDGPSHNGMWDTSVLRVVPGLRIAAPRDAATLEDELREALDSQGPTVLRFPKGNVGTEVPALMRIEGVDLLHDASAGTGSQVLIVAAGATAPACLRAARLLSEAGVEATVVDPRWVVPVDPAIVDLAAAHEAVVTVEDGLVAGGIGSAVAERLADARVWTPVHRVGIPHAYLPHASRGELLDRCGLTAEGIAARALAAVGRPALLPVAQPTIRHRRRTPVIADGLGRPRRHLRVSRLKGLLR